MQILKKLLKPKSNKNNKERCIILDTSALESNNIMKVIQNASKVILLCTTIEEMDKYKKAQNLFGANIREISRRSQEDKKSEKYICVAGYKRNKYNDKNIIDYCRVHRETIIVTGDNNLCNFAKAYKINYIFLEPEKDSKEVKKPKKSTQKKKVIKKKKNIIEEEKNIIKEEKDIIGKEKVFFYNNYIRVCRYEKYHTEIRLERNNRLINIQDYQEGDYLYILRYNKIYKYVEITVMEIVLEKNKYKAHEKGEKQRVYYINEIYKLNFSEELKEEIKKILLHDTKY
jgi:hypothetical protein